ncbi:MULTISPECIES: endonuclease/exonuclease/phosphatase family protein [unclassified Siphonobacter]|uniref:endonuclease/exonuclease/phosphatase family protein n=1 Tax=unclassified Siphonobacter TaxID=2635712 RepID=UPI0012FEC8BF|nr:MULTISPECIES: endonuclease/exonuclease/phosphatase family protein [unclassified Siphonobacter]MDR6195554.1 endonuclease/exonuclease/phosphatase (EEP) superfamily protein YafD [Siphonobacter sp. SORGH_AS_0500]
MKTEEISAPVKNDKAERNFNFWQSTVAFMTYALLLVCILGRFGTYFFFFELFSHFAVQCLGVSVFLLIYWILFRNRLYVIALFSVILNAWQVFPWLQRTDTSGTADLRIMHTNVLFTNTNYEAIVRGIAKEKADIVLIAEATPPIFQHFRKSLGAEYPYQYMVYTKSHCYNVIGSRFPIEVDHAAVTANRMMHVYANVKGKKVALISVHPKTPLSSLWFKLRNERISKAFALAAQEKVPAILAGDFNVSVFSPVYQSLVNESGLHASRKGIGLFPTYRNGYGPLMIPIDHVLTNKGFKTVGFHTADIEDSDHKAIIVDLKFQ